MDYLITSGNYENYMTKLVNSFNPIAAKIMCKFTLSVSWDGYLYDCDFNQMLEMTVNHGAPKHLKDFDENSINWSKNCYKVNIATVVQPEQAQIRQWNL